MYCIVHSKNALTPGVKTCNLCMETIISAARKHKNKLAAGPARDTFIMPSRLLRKLLGLMATGFAHPKWNKASIIAPKISRCARGLKVKRPR